MDDIARHEEAETALVAGAELLNGLALWVQEQFESLQPIEAQGPVNQLIGRIAVYAVRQAQALAVLAVSGRGLMTEQAGQLLRGLIELWKVAAWLTEPTNETGRTARAVGLVKGGIAQAREKLEYQRDFVVDAPAVRWEELEDQEARIAGQEAALAGGEAPALPSTRTVCESFGHFERYAYFRWESDPAHASAVALGRMVASQTAEHTHLGGPACPERRASQLIASIETMMDIVRIVSVTLGFDLENLEDLVAGTYERMREHLAPLITSSPTSG